MRGKLSISNHARLLSDGEEIAWVDRNGEIKRVPGRYGDGRGLYLELGERSASWVFRYQRNDTRAGRQGKKRDRMLGLGPLDWVRIPGKDDPAKTRPNIHEARAEAQEARDQLANGIDPIDAKKKKADDSAAEAAKDITFREAAEAWHQSKVPSYKNAKHAAQVITTLRDYAFPILGKMNVRDIDTSHVIKVLKAIWHEKPETASRVRGRIEKVLGWATVGEYRPKDALNPARWRSHLSEVFPATGDIATVKSHAALPYVELPRFMGELSKREALAARALELTILCATRTNETLGARWPEVDWEGKVWTIPAERMKGKKNQRREHRIPLSQPAIAILKRLYETRDADDGFIFIGTEEGKPLSNMGMDMLLRRMNVKTDDKGQTAVTVHGFRSTFKDWVSDCTSYPNIVSEMALAHVIESKVEKAYRRSDLFKKRATMMDAWAKYCYSPVANRANVIPLKGAAK